MILQWILYQDHFLVRWFYSLFERMRLKRKKRCLFRKTNLQSHHFIEKRYLFFADLAMSQRWYAIFCATGAWGAKPIGRVTVKFEKDRFFKFPELSILGDLETGWGGFGLQETLLLTKIQAHYLNSFPQPENPNFFVHLLV